MKIELEFSTGIPPPNVTLLTFHEPSKSWEIGTTSICDGRLMFDDGQGNFIWSRMTGMCWAVLPATPESNAQKKDASK